jgi:hypothetical protein
VSVRYCQGCGVPAVEGGLFCAACGVRLAVAPHVTEARPVAARRRPIARAARATVFVGVAGLLIAIVAVATGTIGIGAPSGSPAASAVGSLATPGASIPDRTPATAPNATAPARPSTTRPTPPATPGIVVAASSLGAVKAFLAARGLGFAGLCSTADPGAGTGAYCTVLYEDRGAVQVHLVGPLGSPPVSWLLVVEGQYGWGVVDAAPAVSASGGPPF